MTSKVSPIDIDHSKKSKRCSCSGILKFLVGALPTIVFGAFTITFSLQQDAVATKNREQDQRQADERSIRSTFESYIDSISNRLLDRKFNRSNPDHLLFIRVKTLTALRYIDGQRKRDVILFLYESGLLRSDIPVEQRLNLEGADVSGIEFVGSPSSRFNLKNLYLRGIHASNVVFRWCHLDGAVFDEATLEYTAIFDSTISRASFRRINGQNLCMSNIILSENDFSGSKIPGIILKTAVYFWGAVDLTNANLFSGTMPDHIYLTRSMLMNDGIITTNARFPDGSFGRIDSSDLVADGDLEESVN